MKQAMLKANSTRRKPDVAEKKPKSDQISKSLAIREAPRSSVRTRQRSMEDTDKEGTRDPSQCRGRGVSWLSPTSSYSSRPLQRSYSDRISRHPTFSNHRNPARRSRSDSLPLRLYVACLRFSTKRREVFALALEPADSNWLISSSKLFWPDLALC